MSEVYLGYASPLSHLDPGSSKSKTAKLNGLHKPCLAHELCKALLDDSRATYPGDDGDISDSAIYLGQSGMFGSRLVRLSGTRSVQSCCRN